MNDKSNNFLALILLSAYRSSPSRLNIKGKDYYFSIGIIWNTFKHLIIISGISFIFAVGLKGAGLEIEYLFFNLLLWFYFADIVNSTVSIKIEKSFLEFAGVNIYNLIFSHIYRTTIQWFILLIFSIVLFFILNIDIYETEILIAFSLFTLTGFIYASVMTFLLHDQEFLIEIHQFFMQALFFATATVIPISIIPEVIRNYLLYIPIVHIQEFIKAPITGIQLTYIDIFYPILFILFGAVLLLPSLYFKGKKVYAKTNK